LAHLPAGTLALGDTGRQLSFPDLYVENTEHIGLEGPNGAGKSTLLRHLLGCIADDLPYLYIPQELTDEQMRGLVNEVRQMPASARGELLSLVARLNSNPDRILAGDALSPGEARKLMLCTGAVNSSQLIIMDEPTNHLDLQSIEAIETMLAAFPGALVLVSHDKHLLDATTQTRWQFLPDGTLGVSTGR
jgi:ATPase subunit of ABC transporter with duplicated ATPase domains